MIQTLSDKLLALFNTLKGTDKPFVNVLDYHTLDNAGYPYMTFEPISFEGSIADTCNNIRTYSFQVLIYQEVTETGGRKEAKEIMTKAVDQIVGLIDKNYTLDGTVNMVAPVGGSITPVTINNGKALVGEITINIRVVEFIN